jgi:hypothetical protein
MGIYTILLNLHSWIRWIFLLLILITITNALLKWLSKKGIGNKQRKLGTITVIIAHTQFLVGTVLYFISPKVKFDVQSFSNSLLRFFTIEHVLLMLIAIAILSIGNSKIKATPNALQASKKTVLWFSIALVIILVAIPWPFRNLGAGWF